MCCKNRVDTPPLPRDMQIGAKCISPILFHTLTVVMQWPKFGHSTTLNNKGYKPHREMRLFHNLARILSYMCRKYRIDTPPLPRDMQSGAKCILSHTLTVVVQWPKFGHSTTLNNKGYKPHREMRLFHNLARILS